MVPKVTVLCGLIDMEFTLFDNTSSGKRVFDVLLDVEEARALVRRLEEGIVKITQQDNK
jgi:hypothetical protein